MRTNKEYLNALKCHKCILRYAWILNRHDIELSAYDNISFEYFYLGNIEKSRIYHDKYVK